MVSLLLLYDGIFSLTPPDILPILFAAMDSATPSVLDAALRSLPMVLPILDFSTIKNELFPVVAQVFSKTTSLAIKVRGLNAFIVLCGGSPETTDDGLNGIGADARKAISATALDKYTMQEKIVPLIRAIKTKEPAVMMAALNVLRIVGQTADADFVAMDILPILWSMSLGPLLNLKQFQTFMDLIKSLSRRVEDEQTKKLQELSGAPDPSTAAPNEDFLGFGGVTGTTFDQANGVNEDDFERLVRGNAAPGLGSPGVAAPSWDDAPNGSAVPPRSKTATPSAPVFSWSTPAASSTPTPRNSTPFAAPSQPSFRTDTPDLGRIEALSPSSTQFSQPLQPTPTQSSFVSQPAAAAPPSSVDWSSATTNPWSSTTASTGATANAFGNLSLGQAVSQARPALASNLSSFFSLPPPQSSSSFSLPPAQQQQFSQSLAFSGGFSLPPPPGGQANAPSNPWTSTAPSSSSLAGNSLASLVPRQQAAGANPGAGMGMGMSMGAMGSGTSSGGGMSLNSLGSAGMGMNTGMGMGMGMGQTQGQQQKSGLDKYESLL
jgi:SCY1-like protein 2